MATAMPTLFIIVEWSTVVVTFVMMASGLPGCVKMYKKGNTSNAPYLLFLLLTIVSAFSLQYALLIQNNILFIINVVSVLVWSSYSAVYLLVSKEKMVPSLKLLAVASLYSAHLYYLKIIPATDVPQVLGNYLTLWCIVAYVLPIEDIVTMVREASNQSCDMPMLIGGTLSSVVWLLYGHLLSDSAIFVPSAVATIVCIGKFVFYFYFMQSAPTKESFPAKSVGNGDMGAELHKELANSREGLRHRN